MVLPQPSKLSSVKLPFQLSPLYIAIAVSAALHASLLAVHFVAPESFKLQAADAALEVILVNAKQHKKPVKADALAQANLEGGGKADAGRAKSPLPDMRKHSDGEDIKAAQKKIALMEEQQQKLLALLNANALLTTPSLADKKQPEPDPQPQQPTGPDTVDSSKQLSRMTAEIAQTIEDQNKRPRKTFISPSTQEVGYAMYYKALQQRIENRGTLNFPQEDGRKLYGELILYIPIYQDGTIYEKEGGVRVERSSGIPALDRAALNIVRRSAPFGRFPPNMRSTDKDDLWIVVTSFKFTRDQGVEAQLRGAQN